MDDLVEISDYRAADSVRDSAEPSSKAGSSKTIAIAFPIRLGTFYAHVLQAFERYTSAYGYHMVAGTIGHLQIENVRPDFLALLNGPFDAIVLIDLPVAFAPDLEDLLPAAKPVVSAGVYTLAKIDCVTIGFDQAVKDAMDHLLVSNPARIAFFGPGIRDESSVLDTFAADSNLDPRIAGYCEAIKRSGRRIELIAGNPGNRRESKMAFRNYVSDYGCPDALFCFNDEMAIAANRVVVDIGLRAPDDVLIIGCDGIEEGDYSVPRLSTIVQPITQLCSEAWRLLTNRLAAAESPPESAVISAKFVAKASSNRAQIDT